MDTVEIKISDSRGFYNTAKIIIKDKEVLNKMEKTIQNYKKISLYPEEFSLSQYSYLNISYVPSKSNITIYNSFDELVYSEKNVNDTFEWDAENNKGDQVLFGLYNPTGKLSHSWPRNMSQIPINLGDPNYDPLFEYGYGMSY